jgi:hypothetical protein
MPVVFLDGLRFSDLDGCLNCYHANTQRPIHGMLGYLPVYFKDQPMVT